jgi:HEAT repeat protein
VEPPAPPAPPEEPPERQTTPFLVLQFFIFPMAIVAVCVTVFAVFGLIASEGKSARDYLAEIRTGGQSRRWQAAFELSKVLQGGKDPSLRDPAFVSEALALFDDSRQDDPRVRRYLALALGRLGDPAAVPALRTAIQSSDADSETLIYAVWSLGVLGDAAAVPDLVRLASHQDPGIRKASIHALGGFASPEAAAALRAALADAADDVRWNAALALGRRRDPAARPVLVQMLDRAALQKVQLSGGAGSERVSGEQVEEILIQAVAAAGASGDPGLRPALEALRDADPSLKVRDAAQRALGSQLD